MLNNEIIIKRLAIIKYLYKIGLNQSKDVEIIAGFSLLSFHDSIEMFLLLVAEKNGVGTAKLSLMDYWDKFPDLTLKESIRALKDRRVNIKHKGLFPSKSDIEISRVCCTDFLEQNTKIQFGIEFKDVSLFDLMNYQEVKNQLLEAQRKLEEGDFDISLEKSAIAFYELMQSYENSKKMPYSESFFSTGKKIDTLGRLNAYKFKTMDKKPYVPKEVGDILQDIEKTLEQIQSVLKINSLGIDYKQYVIFNVMTPNFQKQLNGNFIFHDRNNSFSEIKKTKENCQFCIDFVLNCSLRLQEFDFNMEQYLELKSNK